MLQNIIILLNPLERLTDLQLFLRVCRESYHLDRCFYWIQPGLRKASSLCFTFLPDNPLLCSYRHRPDSGIRPDRHSPSDQLCRLLPQLRRSCPHFLCSCHGFFLWFQSLFEPLLDRLAFFPL